MLKAVSTVGENKMTSDARVIIPAMFIPGFRTSLAIQNNCEKNILFRTWGGLGDQICAEPTLRYALKYFSKDMASISLTSERPELFTHLNFKEVFDETKARPLFEKYLLFETITPPDESNLVWQFFSHMLTNCVDFPSLCALRSQLPVADREIYLEGQTTPAAEGLENKVFIHAGRHWPSKTFPKEWWDIVIRTIAESGAIPVLIGADTDDNRGTVDVDATHCLDLRNRLTAKETIHTLQKAKVLLTNDSAPLHMAASCDPNDKDLTGNCWIGYIATCKHPDYITHHRKGVWQWREVNHGLGGMWDIVSHIPNQEKKVEVDKIDLEILKSWLPEPRKFAQWGLGKL